MADKLPISTFTEFGVVCPDKGYTRPTIPAGMSQEDYVEQECDQIADQIMGENDQKFDSKTTIEQDCELAWYLEQTCDQDKMNADSGLKKFCDGAAEDRDELRETYANFMGAGAFIFCCLCFIIFIGCCFLAGCISRAFNRNKQQ